MAESLVVIDTETTGFGRHDRIVEVSAVTLDPGSLEITDEYDTLINPERDMGAVGVHGVTASMVEAAPTFQEVGAALARRLQGAVLVAHNLAFDERMLRQEFERLGTTFSGGRGICTLARTSEKLIAACARYGVELLDQHRALADARATAGLLKALGSSPSELQAMSIGHLDDVPNPRTLRRGIVSGARQSTMCRIVSLGQYPYSDEPRLQYLDMLDWALDDAVISTAEWSELGALAEELGLSEPQRERAHQEYVAAIISAAQRDHVITQAEHELIKRIAAALSVTEVAVPDVTRAESASSIEAGMSVCFTGEAVVAGKVVVRSDLEEMATRAGLQPVSSVTKKGCDLLVAADPSSMSGKVKKASRYDIPVMSVEAFLTDLDLR